MNLMKCLKKVKSISPIKTKKAFTLIEILIVLAIIVILSGAVLVSISSQREKAQVNKVLAEISARLQPMMMCWSDGGTVSQANLCTLPNYGYWPTLPAGFSRSFSGNASAWMIIIDGGGSRICCNSATSQCGVIGVASTCNATTPSSF